MICHQCGSTEWEFLTAAEQNDDSGRRFEDQAFCMGCGSPRPRQRSKPVRLEVNPAWPLR